LATTLRALRDSENPNLLMRATAARLFDEIEQCTDREVVVDFTDVAFVSSVFAMEFLLREQRSAKTVTKVHVDENVERMFREVRRRLALRAHASSPVA
jgi:hypothetical protein